MSVYSAQPGNGSTENPALGVEVCRCPQQYSGLSCQVRRSLNVHIEFVCFARLPYVSRKSPYFDKLAESVE